MRKLFLRSVAAAAVISSGAYASIATDGTGQYLNSGQYYAIPGFSTNVKLINTNLESSVIMRGVVREYMSSEEIDFIITLSPGDVWEADLTYENGKAILTSTDDSNWKPTGTLAASDDIAQGIDMVAKHLAAYPARTGRDFTKGYVEFYPIAQFDHNSTAIVPKARTTGVFDLFTAVDQLAAETNASVINFDGLDATIVDNDSVAGYTTITALTQNAVMTLPMLAIEGLDAATDFNTTYADTTGVVKGLAMAPTQVTNHLAYFSPAGISKIRGDLNISTVTVPFEAGAENSDLKFTWVMDGRRASNGETQECVQERSFGLAMRDMEEGRPLGTNGAISPAPAGSTSSTTCEMNTVVLSDLIVATTNLTSVDLASGGDYEKGMVQLWDFDDITPTTGITDEFGTGPDNLSSVVTYMKATPVDSGYSYNWVYPVVERP